MGYMIDSDILLDLIHIELTTFLSTLNIMIPEDRRQHFEIAMGGIIKRAGEWTPTAEAPGWIPCTEKLPKEDEYVLICFEDDPKEKWYCRMAVGWLEDGYWQCWDDRANTRKDVAAWMPLPEPFKGGEEHETD